MTKKILIVIALLLSGTGLALLTKEGGDLPAYTKRTEKVEAAYQYAVEEPELLSQIPCYCNCARLGHKNVEDCFVKKLRKDGSPVYDSHGSNCGICYSIVLDTKKMAQEQRSAAAIRGLIDNKYSQYGRGTPTPKPD